MSQITSLNNAFIAVKDGLIIAVGTKDYTEYQGADTCYHDAAGLLVTPGLIDSHTHVVHAGSREHEFEQKMRGVPYLDILKQGGGIHSTVKLTKEASEETLYNQALKSLNRMMIHGVTTVEGKSGYGLDAETELKQLRVQKTLNQNHPMDIVSTFMGAHAIPKPYLTNHQIYLDQVVSMMDQIKQEKLATFVDVFCEKGVFSASESYFVLSEAKKRGFDIKIHTDEIASIGGVEVARRLGASSADHLMAITLNDMKLLSQGRTIATVLPSTSFYLNAEYAPARKMIKNNLALAIASDYNPGSSPSENFLFTLNLAAIHLKLSPNEILNAATINPAFSLNKGKSHGVIAPGYVADIVIYDAKNWPYVLYHFAINHVKDVIKNGVFIVKNSEIVKGETR